MGRLATLAQTSAPEAASCDLQAPGPFIGPTGLIMAGRKTKVNHATRRALGPAPRLCLSMLGVTPAAAVGGVLKSHDGPGQEHRRYCQRLTEEDSEAEKAEELDQSRSAQGTPGRPRRFWPQPLSLCRKAFQGMWSPGTSPWGRV